jgi:hypothetical protein
VAWGPFDTRMPLGTAGLVGVPIQDEGLQVIAMGNLVSLNLSYFVARKIWRRRGVSPRHYRAHRL